jgi:hypothetical protein
VVEELGPVVSLNQYPTYEDECGGTYACQFDAAVTTFGGCAALLDVQVSELAARGLGNADFVGASVVTVKSSG